MRKTSVWALTATAIFAAVLGAACGGDETEDGGGVCADVDCGSSPTFSQLNWSLCTNCHSNDATVRTNEGVPADSDYTTYAGVSSRIQEIANRVNDGSAPMPPPSNPGQPTPQEKEAFTTWGCCEGPQ